MTNKPVVFYRTDKRAHIAVGTHAWVFPINHTSIRVSNNHIARTSVVITHLPNGVFETQNSIYKPEEMQ